MHTTDFLAKAGSPGKKTPNKKKPAETKTTPKSVKLEPEPGPSSDPKPGKIIHLQNKINIEEFFLFLSRMYPAVYAYMWYCIASETGEKSVSGECVAGLYFLCDHHIN